MPIQNTALASTSGTGGINPMIAPTAAKMIPNMRNPSLYIVNQK